MTVGQLARAAGVKPSTVRYYEQIGVIARPMRTAAGYRVFTEQAIRRLTLVRTAQRFGFSLREISAFFRTRDAGGRPCETVREAAAQMLTTIDAEIGALQAKRRQVRRTLRRWDDMLARIPPDGRAFLLESLAPARHRRRASTTPESRPDSLRE